MIRFFLAQMNTVVGDIEGNSGRIVESIARAEAAGAQIAAFPELAVTGYPPEDLVLKDGFVSANQRALEDIAHATGGVLVIVGFVDAEPGRLYNAAGLCHRGEIVGVYRKHLLPNYGVFDEQRYFEPGRDHVLIDTELGVIGVCVCEDVWEPEGPAASLGDAGAEVIVNINASPFHKNKLEERERMLGDRARRARSSIVYVNAVGGQDELVFDGGSLVIDAEGIPVARLKQFEEQFEAVDAPLGDAREVRGENMRRLSLELATPRGTTSAVQVHKALDAEAEIYEALKLALRDYVTKNGFTRVVVGLSGGIDSSLTATIAADAIGPENVLGVAMPSEFSTPHSIDDAKQLGENLGIRMIQIPIERPYRAYLDVLDQQLGEEEMALAEENLQARIRGNLLMFISNRYGHLVVATGNKSEAACGFATLYGDMAGGFSVLKDVLKMEVYALARYRNALDPVIPENVFTKPPSAELRPDQLDQDSLPPYDQLDAILEAYIERDEGLAAMLEAGHDEDTVKRVMRLVDRAEYKRRQAAPGPKVTIKAFGRDRRLPITNRWHESDGP